MTKHQRLTTKDQRLVCEAVDRQALARVHAIVARKPWIPRSERCNCGPEERRNRRKRVATLHFVDALDTIRVRGALRELTRARDGGARFGGRYRAIASSSHQHRRLVRDDEFLARIDARG